jgi:hypothetical protein
MDHPEGSTTSVMLDVGGKSVAGPVQSTPTFPHAAEVLEALLYTSATKRTYARLATSRSAPCTTKHLVGNFSYHENN